MSFWTTPIGVLLDGVEADWALLEDRDFIRRRLSSSLAGEPEYVFKHALTREVAYASLAQGEASTTPRSLRFMARALWPGPR